MNISLNPGAVRETSWREYAIRFAFGGGITTLTGELAHLYGPGIGGLFLAFPAILPASLTLLAAQQRNRKARLGLRGAVRGGYAAALDARGATWGSIGLLMFGNTSYWLLPHHRASIVLTIATFVWIAGCLTVWWWVHDRRR